MAEARILRKLTAIKAMAEGAKAIGSEEEAQAFANMLQKMLLEHKLSMSDVEFAAMEKDEPVHQRAIIYPPNPDAARNYGKHRKTRVAWMEQLGSVIAKAHFCQIVVHPGTTRLSLIGRESDIQVAEYMIVVLQRAADKLGYDAKQAFKKELAQTGRHVSEAEGFRESWVTAFTRRLMQRYEAERTAQTEGPSNCTALVRLNKAERDVADFIKAKMALGKDAAGKLKNSAALARPSKAPHAEGWRRGTDAANRVDLRANGINTAKPVGHIK